MKRTCVPLACVSIIILLLVTGVSPIFAHHRSRVLGESTQAADMVFPPVTSGPGLLLPDSPLFFLDLFKQAVRVAMALDPADRARIHGLIAGERLAELRIMFTRNNESAISTDLLLLTQEMDKAAKSLSEATAAGQDTTTLAKELVLSVKEARSTLNTLIGQSQGGLKLQLKAARLSLKESKVEIEDSLSKEELERETVSNLSEALEEQAIDASDLAEEVKNDVQRYNTVAAQSGQRQAVNAATVDTILNNLQNTIQTLKKYAAPTSVPSRIPTPTPSPSQ